MGVTGRQATMAFGVLVANSWGVPTSVTKRVYFESDAGMTSRPTYVDDASFGQTFLGRADVGDFQPIDVTLAGQDVLRPLDALVGGGGDGIAGGRDRRVLAGRVLARRLQPRHRPRRAD